MRSEIDGRRLVWRQWVLTRPLAELMMEGKRAGELAALDWIAPALANALYRRHEPAAPGRMVTNLEGLMEEATEWIIPPGACELEEELARVQALRERDLEERERERVELARLQALRERDRGDSLIRLLGRLAPDLDGERLAGLSPEELAALAEKLS